MSPQCPTGSAHWRECHSRLCPSGTGGFLLAEVTPLCCHRAVPPEPEGPCVHGSPKGHPKGHGVISPPALPCYSAVPGQAVALSQPCCARQGDSTGQVPAQPAPHSLHPPAMGGWLQNPRARHPAVPGHPPRDTHHGTPITGHALCQPAAHASAPVGSHSLCAGIQARPRFPGHGHTALGMATCPQGCTKHDPGRGRGSRALPSPGTPGTSPLPRRGPCLGPSPVPTPRPACARGALLSVMLRVRVLGLPPHCWDSGPSPKATTGRGEGSGSPESAQWGQKQGWGRGRCSSRPPAQLGLSRLLSPSAANP